MNTIYYNGQYLPEDQPCISPLDRGFIFGDGVYEVIPAYNGHLFRIHEHLDRLGNNLKHVSIDPPLSRESWQSVLNELVARNGGGDQSVYLQVTRGVARRDHGFPRDTKPTVFAMTSPLHAVSDDIRKDGVRAITLEDIRWKYCHIKTIALLPNILLRQQALDAGAVEAILIRDGNITEGAASNVFIVKNNTIVTPPKGPLLLPGITRDLVLELARDSGLACREDAITPDELRLADEIWLTSSTKEILPVTRLDDHTIGNGQPGPYWQRMIGIYQEYKQHYPDENRRTASSA